MMQIAKFVDEIYSRCSIYKILTVERIQQKFQHGVDPKIIKPIIRDDLNNYVCSLLPEFNYSKNFRSGKGYYPILFMRRSREDPKLSKWMNKIWIHEYLQNLGLPTLEHYFASYETAPPEKILKRHSQFVAKPAHMSEGDCVFVVADGFDLKSGAKVDAQQISVSLSEAMSLKTVSWDTWGTRNSRAGVVVEEMSANGDGEFTSMPDEVKIHCVWGKVYFGVWRRGNVYQRGGFLYRDHFNEFLTPDDQAWWSTMIECAEVAAAGTDLLRVDMFVNGGSPVISEVEIMPATPVPRALQTEMAKLLNAGYSFYHSCK